jgi:plastocyanin
MKVIIERSKMRTLFVLLLTILLSATAVVPSIAYSQASTPTSTTDLIGQQYFENGTGISYFSDNSSKLFTHSITPQNGFLYDNSTTYTIGEVPASSAMSNNNNTNASSNISPPATGKVINITIPSGADLLPANQTFQPNSVTVKVGDIMQFVNRDSQSHRIVSPPSTLFDLSNKSVPSGVTFDTGDLSPGQISANMTVLRPGGYHYNDNYNEASTGTIIIVK